MDIVAAQDDLELGGRGEAQLRAAADRPLAVGIAGAGGDILQIAVAAAGDQRKGCGELVLDDRAADIAFEPHEIVIAIGRLEPPFEAVAGPAADHVDRSAHRIAAVERALRSAQHLDPLHIQEIGEITGRASEIDPVEMDSRRGIGAAEHIVRADAANIDLREGRVLRHQQVRRQRGEIAHILDAGDVERLAVEGGDRQRRVLEAGRTGAGRGDDDIAVILFRRFHRRRFGGLGEGGPRKGQDGSGIEGS